MKPLKIAFSLLLMLVLTAVLFLISWQPPAKEPPPTILPLTASAKDVTANIDEGNEFIEAPEFLPGKLMGVLEKGRVTEASGMVASRKNKDVIWVHNDAGDASNIFAHTTGGEFIRAFNIEKAKNRDWEDIAIGPGPKEDTDYLYIGDIGDNDADHSSYKIYRIEEPDVDPNDKEDSAKKKNDEDIGPADEFEFVYPDGPKDAETLLVDPLSGDIYIITKGRSFSMVYIAPYPQSADEQIVLDFIGTIPLALAVGGDVSPDGSSIIVKSLNKAAMWFRPEGEKLWQAFGYVPLELEIMNEPQGEAICFDAAGSGYFTISEMKHPNIYYFAAKTEQEETID